MGQGRGPCRKLCQAAPHAQGNSRPQTRTRHDGSGWLQGLKRAFPSASLQALHALEVTHFLQDSKGFCWHPLSTQTLPHGRRQQPGEAGTPTRQHGQEPRLGAADVSASLFKGHDRWGGGLLAAHFYTTGKHERQEEESPTHPAPSQLAGEPPL